MIEKTNLNAKMPLNQQILESLNSILSHSEHITVNRERLQNFAFKLDKKTLREIERRDSTPELIGKYIRNKWDAIDLVCIFNSLNFCYWYQDRTDAWTYFSELTGAEESGARALLLALIENYYRDNRFFFGSNLKNLTRKKLKEALINRTNIPLFQQRLQILKEVGETIEEQYDNHFYNFIQANSQFKASQIISNLVRDFPSFNDSNLYRAQRVWFLKRAQLMMSRIYSISGDLLEHPIIDELTAFSDYMLPVILEYLGILQYSSELKENIKERKLIPKGSQMELEIRAFTIYAVEEIKANCQIKINSPQIDKVLWTKSHQIDRNHHLTPTTAY